MIPVIAAFITAGLVLIIKGISVEAGIALVFVGGFIAVTTFVI